MQMRGADESPIGMLADRLTNSLNNPLSRRITFRPRAG
jgi:hypothetical protein